MSEEEFYHMEDAMENFGDVTAGYYPTVNELKRAHAEEHPEKYIPLLLYFSDDPFKRLGRKEKNDHDYKELVSFAKRLLYKVELAG